MGLEGKSPPTWFLLANSLPYGRHRVLNYLRKLNLINDRIVSVPFYDRTVKLPLNFVNEDLRNYQKRRISKFFTICNGHLQNFEFIDCGAHLGLFTAQFTVFSDRMQKLIAIEPNPLLFSLLQENLHTVRATQVECINAALADFEGRGRLVETEYAPGADAMYLAHDADGDIQVTTLSAVLHNRTQPRVAIKVDVEGLEVPVLCGAADAIRSLNGVVLFVEIYKTVLRRIGISDVEMLAEIEGIRPFSWMNSDNGAAVDSRYGILEQLKLDVQCDLIGIGLGT